MPPTPGFIASLLPADLSAIALAIFLVGTFVAAFVTGLSGFAFGMVAAAIWLHALDPLQGSTLIVAYALMVQGYAVWKLRRSIMPGRLAPFVIGTAVGLPAGLAALNWVPPLYLRIGSGALMIAFSLYNLLRPSVPLVKNAGRGADAAVGVLNGVVGGATGLAGIMPMMWSGLRGWTRDEQRAVFQPTAVATFVMMIGALGGTGLVTAATAKLFVLGVPALAAGTCLGWILYGRLDEATFRKVVLALLLVSGVALVSLGR